MSKELDKVRAKIAALKADIASTETAGLSREELRAAVLGRLRETEADGARALARRVSSVADGESVRLLQPLGDDLAPVLLALLGADAVAAALDRYVSSVPEGMNAAQRAERLRSLRAALFDAELAEEQAVCSAENRGEQVDRRPDAHPAAVLYLPD